jgi:hypothetical protein
VRYGIADHRGVGELRQVVSDALVNSLDAVEKHGTVKLRASVAPCRENGQRCIRITVANSGKGSQAAF